MHFHQNLNVIFCLLFFTTTSTKITHAQVIPDNTLGTESSVINSVNEIRDRISGGAARGENLFHSFQEFSINNGLEVYFANPEGIANIFSRVTGNNISEILGTLGVEGSANLFFLNPNGIVFGENAFVDVAGSFIATTADKVIFDDNGTFSARDTQKPLLTWDAPIGLGLNGNNGDIIVKGLGNNLSIPIPEFNIIRENRPTGISVQSNNTIGLLGGNITLEGGNLTAPEGRIELGSVREGQVGLTSVAEGWKFNYDDVTTFQDINLTQAASIDTTGNSGGAIQIRGREINVNDGSAIVSNTSDGNGRGIKIESDSLQLSGVTSDDFVSVIASDNNGGTGGDINIKTNQLSMSDGSQIRANVFEDGTTGEVNINANDIDIIGINPLNSEFLTTIETSVAVESVGGTGKDVNIDTQNLFISGGGRILTDVFGIGNGGDLVINAENIRIEDFKNRRISFLTGLSARSRSGNNLEGSVGKIVINTNNLSLINGGDIRTDTENSDSATSIEINAETIEVIGVSPLSSNDPSGIKTSTNDSGSAGNIFIRTNKLLIADGGQISADTISIGNGGDIEINAEEIEILGISPSFSEPSGIKTSTNDSGSAGNIFIRTNKLLIADGGQINANTRDIGNGGDLIISAKDINITGINNINTSRVSSLTSVTRGEGKGGDITINSDNLRVTDGAIIATDSLRGKGNAGNVIITTQNIELTGSNPFNPDIPSGINTSTIDGFGSGGDITINSDNLKIADGSQIRAATIGNDPGIAGNINIEAKNIEIKGRNPAVPDDTELFDTQINSGIIAFTVSNPNSGGEITIDAENLNLAEKARVDSTSFNGGDAGLIDINVDNLSLESDATITTSFIDLREANTDPGDFEFGNAGTIKITADKLTSDNASIASSSELTGGGKIEINAQELFLNNQAQINTEVSSGINQGGNITLKGDRIQLENNSNISASAEGEGNGGNVNITANTVLALNDSDVTARARRGNGGNIDITAGNVLGLKERPATPNNGTSDADASSKFGQDGEVTITNTQKDLEDPILPFRELEINTVEPEFKPDCFEQKQLLKDIRHPNFYEDSNDFSDNAEIPITDNFVPPEPETKETDPIENLVWSEGKPLIPGNHLVISPDGELFLVVKSEFEFLQKKGCISPKFTEYLPNPSNLQSN